MGSALSFRILFVSLTDDVGSSRIIAEFSRCGATCGVLGAADSLASISCYTSRSFPFSNALGLMSLRATLRRKLERILADWAPDRIVPVDEMGSHLLRQIARGPKASAALRERLVISLGASEHYETVTSRGRLMTLAGEAGVRVPEFRIPVGRMAAAAVPAALGYPLVLKREFTCGGAGVSVIRDAAAFSRAYRRATLRATAKRLVLGQDRENSGDPPLVAQAFLQGRVAFHSVACVRGRVLSGVSFVCERQDPPEVGASTIIRHFEHDEMTSGANLLVQRLGISGFAGFDYIVDAAGAAHLIELNARPIGSVHLGARFGRDLIGSYIASEAGAPPPRPRADLPAGQAIALFPREMFRNPASDALAPDSGLLHDAPWDDPPVLLKVRERLVLKHPDKSALIARILDDPPDIAALPRTPMREAG